jgi:hypothetical protein
MTALDTQRLQEAQLKILQSAAEIRKLTERVNALELEVRKLNVALGEASRQPVVSIPNQAPVVLCSGPSLDEVEQALQGCN